MREDTLAPLLAALPLAVAGILVWRVVESAARGELRVNGALGLRTRATKASEAAWVTGHRAAVGVVRGCGVTASLTAVLAVALAWAPPWGLVCMLLSTALLLAGAVVGAVRADRAAKSVTPRSQ